MRHILVFASLITLSIALGSTLMVIVALGGATSTVESSVDAMVDEGSSAVQGLVTLRIGEQDDEALREGLAVPDATG
ncbi:hypothetical protein JXA12_04770 [Candidatus Woesearchaeota archaeon]|nr:hypothetical protein [Candidatus Woesearchaeota archaeon]